MISFGRFPGVSVLIADVSEHCIGSIFKGRSKKDDLPLKMEPIQCYETSASKRKILH
jgi:hypothetical protein